MKCILTPIVMIAVLTLAAPRQASAQSISASDRDALVRLRVDRGGRAEEVDALLRVADEAAAKKLPAAPITNKIREGLAKGVDPKRIELVVRQISSNLETADRMVRDVDAQASGAPHDTAVTLLAESLGNGVTPDEVRELRKLPSVSIESLASAARGLAFIKDAQLSAADGASVIAEAVRKGFRPQEVLDVGREVKRRETEYKSGRATLRALRDAIARGERPEQLFREARAETVTRPAATQTETIAERPVARPDTQRPEQPARPEQPTRPEQPARPERPATRDTR